MTPVSASTFCVTPSTQRLLRKLPGPDTIPIGISLVGERGVGKLALAHHLHDQRRSEGPLVVWDGKAPEKITVWEAGRDRRTEVHGLPPTDDRTWMYQALQAAHGGTLIVTHVEDAPGHELNILGDYLDHHEISANPFGGRRLRINVWVIATGRVSLPTLVPHCLIPGAIAYGLVGPFEVLPLNCRRGEIFPLLKHLLGVAALESGVSVPQLHSCAGRTLARCEWPRNMHDVAAVARGLLEHASHGVLHDAHILKVMEAVCRQS